MALLVCLASTAALAAKDEFNPDILLTNPTKPYVGMRSFDFSSPADGFYRFELVYSCPLTYANILLDGKFLYHFKNGAIGMPRPVANRLGTVTYLTKGKHTLRYRGYDHPWHFNDVAKTMESLQMGFTRVSDPAATLRATELDRQDMVFALNEPLTLRLEQVTGAQPATYTVKIKRQRDGSGKTVWEKPVTLPANNAHAVADVVYPCGDEGAYEYSVFDASGKVRVGPWSFCVIDSTPLPIPIASGPPQEAPRVLVDSVDCALEDDPAHQFRDNGSSKVQDSPVGRYRVTGERRLWTNTYKQGKDGKYSLANPGEAGLSYAAADWFAYTLQVKHPGKAHIVTAYIPNDLRRKVVVQAYDQVTGNSNAGLLDTGDAPEGGKLAKLSFLIYPNGKAIDVTSFCSNGNHNSDLNRQGAVAKIELYELPEGLPPMPEAAGGWAKNKEFGWQGEQLDIGIFERMMPRLWSGDEMVPGVMSGQAWGRGGYHDWQAVFDVWNRYGSFSMYSGENRIILPVATYGLSYLDVDLLPNADEAYGGGFKFRPVDRQRRDLMKLILMFCQKYHVKVILDFQESRIYADNILTAYGQDSTRAEGLFLTSMSGKTLYSPHHILSPANELSRRYLKDLYSSIAEKYGKYQSFGGFHHRQTGWNGNTSVWFFTANTCYDDFHVKLFERETGVKVPVASDDPNKIVKRRDWILANAKDVWFKWRCDKNTSLLSELLAAVRKHAPQARFYAKNLEEVDPASGLDPAKLSDPDLGYRDTIGVGGVGIELNGLDPLEYANFDRREGVVHRTLDNLMPQEVSYPRGLCSGAGSIPCGPYIREKLALALAERPLKEVYFGGPWIIGEIDTGLRPWTQAWRAIPALDFKRLAVGDDQSVVCWSAKSVFYLVNRTDRPQNVRVDFAGEARKISDRVYGQSFPDGKSLELTIEPYMLRVLESEGSPVAVKAIPDAALVASLRSKLAQLESIAPKAAGLVETRRGAGEKYVSMKFGEEIYDDGEWGRRDLSFTFDALLKPIQKAMAAGDYGDASLLLEQFVRDHSWWLEAFGWFEGDYRFRPAKGDLSDARKLASLLESKGPIVLERRADAPVETLRVPDGAASLKWKTAVPDGYSLTVWMLSGGDLGPVSVLVDGARSGELGVAGGNPYFGHFTLARPVVMGGGKHVVELRAPAGQPLVVAAVEFTQNPPRPIRQWSAIGLFEIGKVKSQYFHEAVGMDQVFAPETEIKLDKTYPGLDGVPAKWRQIDIGDDKFIQLLEKYYPYDYSVGNGVAYLATWVYSPTRRDATLYYAIDWFGKIWVNDELILGDVGGPWKVFATERITLRQGWNKLLVKTACGRSSWKANLALSDPGDLKYSPTPPLD